MPLISIHIPKTGGTTFLELLSKHYGESLLLDYGLSHEEGPLKVAEGVYTCVHGHFKTDKYKEVADVEYILWLRNPIQRLFSQYYFWKNSKFPHSRAWRRFHFEDWSFADFSLSPITRNEQSKYVGGLNISAAKVVGITEYFNESMDLFNAELGMNIDVSSMPQHRRNRDVSSVDAYQVKDKGLEAAILEYHRKDYELYLEGLTRFRKQYDAISDHLSAVYCGPQRTVADTRSEPFSLLKLIQEKGVEKIVGTYYYGDGWPINMWDTFRRDVADTYLDKMKADGFNTVILLIPAAVPKLSVENKEHYAIFLDDLRFMIRKIEERGMYFMYRLGFSWDGFPLKGDRGRFCFSILAGGDELALAKSVFGALWDDAKEHEHFLYGFITWEDMLMFSWNRASRAGELMRKRLAEELGYSGEAGMIPGPDSLEFKDYLDFIDIKFSNLFYELQTVFPRLSAEVRVDATPFIDADGNHQHYVHNRHFVETDCDIIGTYFGTYMIHGTPTSESAVTGLRVAHQNLRNVAPDKKIFIDQLLLIIKEQRYDAYPKLSEYELQKFVNWLPQWLKEHSVGYATWSFSDYLWDVVFNGTFKYGLQGWDVTGMVKLVDSEGHRYVRLRPGEAICGSRIEHFAPWVNNGLVYIDAVVSDDIELLVTLSDQISITLTGDDFAQPEGRSGKVAISAFTGQSEYIKVSPVKGSADIFRVGVGKEVISNGGHDITLGSRSSARMIAQMNERYLSLS